MKFICIDYHNLEIFLIVLKFTFVLMMKKWFVKQINRGKPLWTEYLKFITNSKKKLLSSNLNGALKASFTFICNTWDDRLITVVFIYSLSLFLKAFS